MDYFFRGCCALFSDTFEACMDIGFFRGFAGFVVYYIALGMFRLLTGLRRRD